MENRTHQRTDFQVKQEKAKRHSTQDSERTLKRQIGIIAEVDPLNRNRLEIKAQVPVAGGGKRLWGGANGAVIPIADAPLDILARFGEVRAGMVVELFWTGTTETGVVVAHIIGQTSEEAQASNLIARDPLVPASSRVFEPGGF